MNKDGTDNSKDPNIKWRVDENNENTIIWTNETKIAKVKIIAKKLPSSEWKMFPEINDKKDENTGITVPDKRCVISMITSMKKMIDSYLIEASKSGKTIEEVIKNANLF